MAITFVEKTHGSVKKIKATIVSDGSGDAAGETTFAAFDGACLLLTTDPAGGGDAPSDNWDLVVTDDDGVDVLAGAGANRDTATTEQVIGSSLGAVAGSSLTFTASNMGDTKTAVVYLYIR